MFAYLISPDVWTAGAVMGVLSGGFAGYHALAWLRGRPAPEYVPMPAVVGPPLAIGDWVEVISGPWRGLCGAVEEVVLQTCSDGDGVTRVLVRLQTGERIHPERADVRPV